MNLIDLNILSQCPHQRSLASPNHGKHLIDLMDGCAIFYAQQQLYNRNIN